MTALPVLPAPQEVANRQLIARIDRHESDGYAVPCRGAEAGLWISDAAKEQRVAAAECAWCPALIACRDYALTYPESAGVYGGTTPKQRQLMGQREAAA